MENFNTLISKYATEKGFVIVTGSEFYNSTLKRFNIYSDSYKNIMPYYFFLNNIIL